MGVVVVGDGDAIWRVVVLVLVVVVCLVGVVEDTEVSLSGVDCTVDSSVITKVEYSVDVRVET